MVPVAVAARVQYHERLTRVANRLNLQNGVGMGLAAAASLACMERTSFSRYFKRATGITYIAFRRLMRIEKAINLIRTSDVSITEVALAVGFATAASFEKAFKDTVGITPGEYRRRVLTASPISSQCSGLPRETLTAQDFREQRLQAGALGDERENRC